MNAGVQISSAYGNLGGWIYSWWQHCCWSISGPTQWNMCCIHMHEGNMPTLYPFMRFFHLDRKDSLQGIYVFTGVKVGNSIWCIFFLTKHMLSVLWMARDICGSWHPRCDLGCQHHPCEQWFSSVRFYLCGANSHQELAVITQDATIPHGQAKCESGK